MTRYERILCFGRNFSTAKFFFRQVWRCQAASVTPPPPVAVEDMTETTGMAEGILKAAYESDMAGEFDVEKSYAVVRYAKFFSTLVPIQA